MIAAETSVGIGAVQVAPLVVLTVTLSTKKLLPVDWLDSKRTKRETPVA